MSKKIFISVSFLVIISIFTLLTGCGKVADSSSGGGSSYVSVLTRLAISNTQSSVQPNQQIQIVAIAYDQNDNVMDVDISWDVSGNIGSISSTGVFTAANTSSGQGTITAYVGAIQTSFEITVEGTVLTVTEVNVLDEHVLLNIGDKLKLSVLVLPAGISQLVRWEVAAPSVVTISSEGELIGLQAGTTEVFAYSELDPTKYDSCIVEVTANTVPVSLAAPQNPAASKATYEDKIVINWDEVENAEKYYIYRILDNGDYLEIASTNVNYFEYSEEEAARVNCAFIAGKEYTFRLIAWNSDDGSSGYSNSFSGYTSLTAPSYLSASGGLSDKIIISLYITTGIEKYYIYRADALDGSYEEIAVVSTNEYEDMDVVSGKSYYYKTKSWNSLVGFSNDYSYIKEGYTVMPTVENLSATDGTYEDRVVITWDNLEGAIEYRLFRSESEGGSYSLVLTVNTNQAIDTLVDNKKNYYYKVIAYGSKLNYSDDFSNIDCGYRSQEIPVNKVQNLNATDGDYSDKIILSWDSVDNAAGYKIRRCTFGGVNTYFTVTNNEFEDTSGLSGSVLYYYTVQAFVYEYGSTVYGEASDQETGYLGYVSSLAIPENFAASDGNSTLHVELSWSLVSGATDYYIYRSEQEEGPYEQVIHVDPYYLEPNKAFDRDVVVGKRYYYKIRAYNSTNGYSDFSSAESGYLRIGDTPWMRVRNSEEVRGQVKINWDEVSGAKKYYLYIKEEGSQDYDLLDIIEYSDTFYTYTDTTIRTSGVEYTYLLKALDSIGSFSSGETRTCRITEDLPVPSLHDTYSDEDKIYLSWNGIYSPDGVFYYVYRSLEENGDYTTLNYTEEPFFTDQSAVGGGITYYYKIRCCRIEDNGYHNFSAFSDTVTGSLSIEDPENFRASGSSSIYVDRIRIDWSFSPNTADKFFIYRSLDQYGTYDLIAEVEGSSRASYYYEDVVATKNTFYYKIRAWALKGVTSNYVPSDGGVEGSIMSLKNPHQVMASQDNTDYIRVFVDDVSGSTHCYIYKSDGGINGNYSLIALLNRDDMSYGHYVYDDRDNLELGVNYYYKVRVWNQYYGFSTYEDNEACPGYIIVE